MLHMLVKVFDKKDPVPLQVPFLLPHEVIHELHRASALQDGGLENAFSVRMCFLFQGKIPQSNIRLLVIEILGCCSHALQFGRSMTGHRSRKGISEFWKHCLKFDEWRNHPWLQNSEQLGSIMVGISLTFHRRC